jgi:hypothetical protein
MTGDDKYSLFPWFDKKGVKRYLGIKYGKITGKMVIFFTRDGKEVTLETDTVITALPLAENQALADMMTGQAKEIYFIGDVKEPRLIADAVASGAIIADSI